MPMRTDRPLNTSLLSLSKIGWQLGEFSISEGHCSWSSCDWTAKHQSSADVAVGKDTMKASPSVLTSKPPILLSCLRITPLCSLMASLIASGYGSHSCVE